MHSIGLTDEPDANLFVHSSERAPEVHSRLRRAPLPWPEPGRLRLLHLRDNVPGVTHTWSFDVGRTYPARGRMPVLRRIYRDPSPVAQGGRLRGLRRMRPSHRHR